MMRVFFPTNESVYQVNLNSGPVSMEILFFKYLEVSCIWYFFHTIQLFHSVMVTKQMQNSNNQAVYIAL